MRQFGCLQTIVGSSSILIVTDHLKLNKCTDINFVTMFTEVVPFHSQSSLLPRRGLTKQREVEVFEIYPSRYGPLQRCKGWCDNLLRFGWRKSVLGKQQSGLFLKLLLWVRDETATPLNGGVPGTTRNAFSSREAYILPRSY